MHDYLLNKQRRKEEYWIRKYGRVRAERRAQMTVHESHLPPLMQMDLSTYALIPPSLPRILWPHPPLSPVLMQTCR